MKNYFNRWGISVVLLLLAGPVLGQKPPKSKTYQAQPTLVVLTEAQSYGPSGPLLFIR